MNPPTPTQRRSTHPLQKESAYIDESPASVLLPEYNVSPPIQLERMGQTRKRIASAFSIKTEHGPSSCFPAEGPTQRAARSIIYGSHHLGYDRI
jgi:hypothetical protein